MKHLTPIYLSAADIAMFKKFQKHYALIGLLESLGVFDLANGSVEIHFDSHGQIGSVDKRQHFRAPKVPQDIPLHRPTEQATVEA